MSQSKAYKQGSFRAYLNFLKKDFIRHRGLYIMFLPVIVYFILFHYAPMYGAQIAFKDFTPSKGIENSVFVGLKHFESFFNGLYFFRLLKNTLLISLFQMLFGFPAPIVLALLMNEVRNKLFKRFNVFTKLFVVHTVKRIELRHKYRQAIRHILHSFFQYPNMSFV